MRLPEIVHFTTQFSTEPTPEESRSAKWGNEVSIQGVVVSELFCIAELVYLLHISLFSHYDWSAATL